MIHPRVLANLFRNQGERPFCGMKVSGAYYSIEFRKAEMVGKAVFLHCDSFFLENPVKVFFEETALAFHCLGKQVLYVPPFIIRYIDAIGMHPATQPPQGVGAA